MLTIAALAFASPAAAMGDAGELAAYVRARAADADGQSARAAADYARALSGAPDNVVIAIRAYRAGLQAGDTALVEQARKLLDAADVGPRDTAVLALAQALSIGDRTARDAALARIADGPLSFLAPALRAWTLVEGAPDRALAVLAAAPRRSVGARYVTEARSLILISTGQQQAGLTALRAASTGRNGDFSLRATAAQLLAARGTIDEARLLFAGGEAAVGDAVLRLAAAEPMTDPARLGIARLLASLAHDVAEGETAILAIALVRAALILKPGDPPALLALAQALAEEGASAQALSALDQVGTDSPWFAAQQDVRIAVLARAGRSAEALALALPLARADVGDATAHRRVGDLLMASDRFADAGASYRRAIERAGTGAGWRLYLQAGGAFDRAGRWSDAAPLIERAVELAPDEPVALNYLGYGLLENRGDRARATRLLERALALRPDDGSILDSLGWCYFVTGDLPRALPLLERAAAQSPDNATINDHLGDAYWRAGRHFEARYAWGAAKGVATGDDEARIAAKINGAPGSQ